MGKGLPVLSVLFLAAGLFCVRMDGAPSRGGFPEKLLEGIPDFNLAVLFQGDIRGSFGPCG